MFNILGHNPYFNRWFSAINILRNYKGRETKVTILILIDGFLQFKLSDLNIDSSTSHNPYFNRWFSAIYKSDKITDTLEQSQSLF